MASAKLLPQSSLVARLANEGNFFIDDRRICPLPLKAQAVGDDGSRY